MTPRISKTSQHLSKVDIGYRRTFEFFTPHNFSYLLFILIINNYSKKYMKYHYFQLNAFCSK
ncbi:hypothetical protein QTP88_009128 [Uroleucon formosanum]